MTEIENVLGDIANLHPDSYGWLKFPGQDFCSVMQLLFAGCMDWHFCAHCQHKFDYFRCYGADRALGHNSMQYFK